MMRDASLLYDRLQRYLEELAEKGLLARHQDDPSLFYVTEKGLRFVEEFQRFMRLARAFGLEIWNLPRYGIHVKADCVGVRRVEPVRDLKLSANSSVLEVVKRMGEMGGFIGPHLARSLEVLASMMEHEGCLKILTFTGNLVSTGLRGVFADMLRRKLFDLVITTCGAIDHDIARTLSTYYHGTFDADDVELRNRQIHRLGNVFIPFESYGLAIEKFVRSFVESLAPDTVLSTYEVCWRLGELLKSEDSILYWAHVNTIPVVVPGIYDGAVGYNLWLYGKRSGVRVDVARDQDLLDDLMWSHEVKGALIVGGGISKHHAIWWSQFGGEGLDYAVYITSSDEYDGSLSGARPKEAQSWGKVALKARAVFLKADATLVLPFLYVGLLSILEGRSRFSSP